VALGAGPQRHAPLADPRPRRASKRAQVTSAAVSIGAHVGIALAILTATVEAPKLVEPPLMTMVLLDITPTPPSEPAPAPTPAQPQKVEPPPQRSSFRPTPVRHVVDPMPAGEAKTTQRGVEVSESELAGAMTAGSGPPGGACNMVQWLQAALRKDRRVQNVVAEAHSGKPIMVWNGDWVRHADQDGNGLAALREALTWEIAFAPETCRKQAVHGLVVMSLSDAPGAPRLVLGGGDWRWSDLLFPRVAATGETFAMR